MRLSARRIRAINRILAISNNRPFYNEDKPLPPVIPGRNFTRIVYVPPTQP